MKKMLANAENKRCTIYDVAKQANVSPSTVSHVLNGTATISTETQARIRESIRLLDYRPNANARALRQVRSHLLGVIFPDIASEYYAACTAGIIQHAQKENYVVLANDLHFDNEVLAASLPALMERRVDGLIFVGGREDEKYLRMASDANIPVVLGDRFVEGYPCVEFNNFETMKNLVCSLFDAGYRKFAYAGETPNQQQNLERRYQGFLAGLRERNVPDERWSHMLYEELNISAKMPRAYRCFRRFFNETPYRALPEIILTSNDMIAEGAISAALRSGLRVPQDIAVFGFDNISLSAFSTPSVSTVAQDPYLLGETCFRLLMRRIRDGSCPNAMLRQQIVTRASAPVSGEFLLNNGLEIAQKSEDEA